ncbi:MAG TPA: hypothetical protein PK536_05200 [Ignavibacteria bacterium]|nr:hypothetical protein [Bacteroidota bacterium]HRI84828.1 hypothetical protein [Ignavibacteria bacterium]HRK00538.1 hypothetical protein [Ignavibacteria bacterium]
MKNLLIYFIITLILYTFTSCAGVTVSSSVGYGINSGPYGYGSYRYPNVNVGIYHGGYRGYRY